MKNFSDLMPMEVLDIEEVAQVKAGGTNGSESGCVKHACEASTAFQACPARTTCISEAIAPTPPPSVGT